MLPNSKLLWAVYIQQAIKKKQYNKKQQTAKPKRKEQEKKNKILQNMPPIPNPRW